MKTLIRMFKDYDNLEHRSCLGTAKCTF